MGQSNEIFRTVSVSCWVIFFTQRVKSGTETSSQGESNALF